MADSPQDELNTSLGILVNLDWRAKDRSDEVISGLKELSARFGKASLQKWVDQSHKNRNGLLHCFVMRAAVPVLRFLIEDIGCDINQRRGGDGCTISHLAAFYKKKPVLDLILSYKPDLTIQNQYKEPASKIIDCRDKYDHIVWVDLELTALPEVIFEGKKPEIVECAVIITDKNLKELARRAWVISKTEDVLKSLSPWHQREFASIQDHGNGLFEAIRNSTTTAEQFETELLSFLGEHTFEGVSPMAGSSVQNDRDVFLLSHPKLFKWFTHRIIDVSTLIELSSRWNPAIIDQLPPLKPGVAHRAMQDIERSLELLKFFRASGLQMLIQETQ